MDFLLSSEKQITQCSGASFELQGQTCLELCRHAIRNSQRVLFVSRSCFFSIIKERLVNEYEIININDFSFEIGDSKIELFNEKYSRGCRADIIIINEKIPLNVLTNCIYPLIRVNRARLYIFE